MVKAIALILSIFMGQAVAEIKFSGKALTFNDSTAPQFLVLCMEPYTVVGDPSNTVYLDCTAVPRPLTNKLITCVGTPGQGTLTCPSPEASN